jgi:hypothetical protein
MTRKWLRLQVVVVASIALAIIAALVLSGNSGRTIREAAYDVNGINPLLGLSQGGRICEAPVRVDGPFRQLVFWSSGAGSKAVVSVHRGVAPRSKTVSRGFLEAAAVAPGENVVTLTRTVAPSTHLRVCVTSVHGTTTLFGGGGQYLSNSSGSTFGAPVIIGFRPESTLWLQAWSTRPQGIWSSLPLAFRRMSLFRLDWVGAWTFWILLFGVFAAFPLSVMAIWLALKADRGRETDLPPQQGSASRAPGPGDGGHSQAQVDAT